MASIVIELQREALDSNVLLVDLLRKALVVARKLDLEDLRHWIEREVNGYKEADPRPEYRWIVGSLQGLTTFYGWQPIQFEEASLAEKLSRRFIGQPIGQLEYLLKSRKGRELAMPLPKSIELKLIQGADLDVPPIWSVEQSQIFGVIDAVRNIVLDWALRLEKDGILGEDMRFSEREEKIASNTTYNIEMLIGQVSGSQIQQHVVTGKQILGKDTTEQLTELIREIRATLTKDSLSKPQALEVEADLQTVEQQLSSPRPKHVIINEALRSVRSIFEGVAGNAVFTELVNRLSGFIG